MKHIIFMFALFGILALQPGDVFAITGQKLRGSLTLDNAKKEQARLDKKAGPNDVEKGVILESEEGAYFVLTRRAVEQSGSMKAMLESVGENLDQPIRIKHSTNESLLFLSTTLSQMAKMKESRAKRAYIREQLIKEESTVKLIRILHEANFFDIKPLLDVAIDVFAKRIFEKDLERLPLPPEYGYYLDPIISQTKMILNVAMDAFGHPEEEERYELSLKRFMTDDEYAKYKTEVLDSLVADIASLVVSRGLRSIDRVFVSNTPDRRLDAIKALNLATAQIVAYIAKHNTPSADALPDFMRRELDGHGLTNKIHFGPMPIEFAIWPRHCPLKDFPDYNMYAGPKPNQRYIDNDDGTITDICTKLIWEKVPAKADVDWTQGKSHCTNLVKADATDWRAPTVVELQSIVDYAKKNTSQSNEIFYRGSWNADNFYWSGTGVAGDTNRAWAVDVDIGLVSQAVLNDVARMGCVRGPSAGISSAAAMSHYTISSSKEVVFDNFTGETWQRTSLDDKEYEEALNICPKLNLDGKKDWRLPVIEELSTLVDRGKKEPAIDNAAFPDTSSLSFWSASPLVGVTDFAWLVHFKPGMVFFGDVEYDDYSLRCVR